MYIVFQDSVIVCRFQVNVIEAGLSSGFLVDVAKGPLRLADRKRVMRIRETNYPPPSMFYDQDSIWLSETPYCVPDVRW